MLRIAQTQRRYRQCSSLRNEWFAAVIFDSQPEHTSIVFWAVSLFPADLAPSLCLRADLYPAKLARDKGGAPVRIARSSSHQPLENTDTGDSANDYENQMHFWALHIELAPGFTTGGAEPDLDRECEECRPNRQGHRLSV